MFTFQNFNNFWCCSIKLPKLLSQMQPLTGDNTPDGTNCFRLGCSYSLILFAFASFCWLELDLELDLSGRTCKSWNSCMFETISVLSSHMSDILCGLYILERQPSPSFFQLCRHWPIVHWHGEVQDQPVPPRILAGTRWQTQTAFIEERNYSHLVLRWIRSEDLMYNKMTMVDNPII